MRLPNGVQRTMHADICAYSTSYVGKYGCTELVSLWVPYIDHEHHVFKKPKILLPQTSEISLEHTLLLADAIQRMRPLIENPPQLKKPQMIKTSSGWYIAEPDLIQETTELDI